MKLSAIILKAVENIFARNKKDIHTNIVCQVVSYDEENNTCSVQPCVRVMRSSDPRNMKPFQLPQVDEVPVYQHGSGKLLLSVSPAIGSYGNLAVSENSIESWLIDGGIVNPTSTRSHHFSDGIFYPGLYPLKVDGDNGKIASPIKTDRISIRTRDGNTEISVLYDNTIYIKSSDKIVVECDEMSVNGETDSVALSTALDSYLSRLDTVLRTWVVLPADGGAALKSAYALAIPTAPSSVASAALKAGE